MNRVAPEEEVPARLGSEAEIAAATKIAACQRGSALRKKKGQIKKSRTTGRVVRPRKRRQSLGDQTKRDHKSLLRMNEQLEQIKRAAASGPKSAAVAEGTKSTEAREPARTDDAAAGEGSAASAGTSSALARWTPPPVVKYAIVPDPAWERARNFVAQNGI